MKTLTIKQFDPYLPPAYLANGLIGLRVGQIPLTGGTALVNSYIGKSPTKESDEYAAAPYPVGADIGVNGRYLSERPAAATFISQDYDMSCGELRSRFVYSFEDITATVDVLTLCNRRFPGVVQQEIGVAVNKPCDLVVQAHVDPRGLPGRLLDWYRPSHNTDGILHWQAPEGFSRIGAAYLATCCQEGVRKIRNDYAHERDLQLSRFAIAAEPGQRYVMRQLGSLVPSLMHGEPHLQAARLVEHANWYGFDDLRRRNRAAWEALWQSRVRLVGADPVWQELVDTSFFYLHSSVSPATPSSIAPFGLSQNGYAGHVFWDTETFMFPAVLLTAPAAAQAMVEYRARCVPQARFNAMLNGGTGLQFPWQSGNHGYEVSSYYTEGNAELHINVDIAFAMIQYVNATGDDIFFRQHAWPMVKGVADWIVATADKTSRGYEIHHVVGIAENFPDVNNNCTLNCLAIEILRAAGRWAERLGVKSGRKWRDVAENIFVPIHPDQRWILPHEGYVYNPAGENWAHINQNEAVYCIEAMMLSFPFGYSHSPEVDAATRKHYLKYLHTYMGMPMEAANCVVWACREGEREMALDFLEAGYSSRRVEPYGMIGECAQFRPGCPNENFVTAQGGLLTAFILGLGGLDIGPGEVREWAKHPIVLPGNWEAIEIDRLYAGEHPFRFRAEQGATKAAIELEE